VPNIHLETLIHAPQALCFDLARDVDAHLASTSATQERAVAGVTHGLMNLGDEVTWEAVHFGVRQRLTAKLTRLERPTLFVDVQVKGAFASFTHTHQFRGAASGTLMIDDFEFVSPLGFLGRLADALFLERHMRRFLIARAQYLKGAAEERAR